MEMEWNKQNHQKEEWSQNKNLIIMLRKAKGRMEFNKKVYRKIVIIEKIFGK